MEETRNPTLQPSGATGSEYTHFAGHPVPDHHGDPAAEYTALRNGVALVEKNQKILRLSGKDPAGMLDAIMTNNVPKEERRGAYAALLDPKGRVQTDLRVLKDREDMLIVTEPEGAEATRAILGRYAPFSRVTMEDLSEPKVPWGVLGIHGPRAPELLGHPEMEEHETGVVDMGGVSLLIAGVRHPVSGYDLIGPAEDLRRVADYLASCGAIKAGHQAYETIRIETGTPRFGPDITPDNFPAEAGILERAVNFAKGCYPGQETVARMHYRGHPNRALHRLVVKGPLPQPNTPILQNDKQVGRITSVAPLPVEGKTLALGYLHRNAGPETLLKAGEAKVSLVLEAKG